MAGCMHLHDLRAGGLRRAAEGASRVALDGAEQQQVLPHGEAAKQHIGLRAIADVLARMCGRAQHVVAHHRACAGTRPQQARQHSHNRCLPCTQSKQHAPFADKSAYFVATLNTKRQLFGSAPALALPSHCCEFCAHIVWFSFGGRR